MEQKSKLCLVAVLFSVVLAVSASVDYKEKDPELTQCKHQCDKLRGTDQEEKQLCEQRCDDSIRQKRQEEKQRRRGGTSFYRYDEDEEQYQGQGQGQLNQNPYLFEDQDFETVIETDQGRVQILQKFTEKSDLLRGIENFRFGSLVTKPTSFVAPHHFDADCVLFVFQGRPTITMVRGEKRERESHNLERGDILRVPAGTPLYIINRDENEKMFIVKLLRPVSLPGQFETFFGGNPESFFNAFSPDVLQAAFKTERDELQRLFGQQRQGAIVKASREQIQKMSHGSHGGEGFWPFHGDQPSTPFSTSSSGPFNLFKMRPSQSNRYGRLFEADCTNYKQLKELDLQISFANITKGSMTAPMFNSKATKIAFVLDGEGFFEMACPHLASQESSPQWQRPQQRSSSPSYQNVRGDLRRGTVFVVPAGHPLTVVASRNNNLQVICFEVNAKGNVKFPLAGKRNVVSQFEREAKELAFGVPVRQVDRIFNKQDDEFFLEGPNQQQGRMWSVV